MASCILYKLFGWHLIHWRVSRLSGDCSAFKKSCSQLSLHRIYFLLLGTSSDFTANETTQLDKQKLSVWFIFSDGDLSNKNGETGRFDHVYVFQSLLMYCTPPSVIYPDSQRQFIAKVLIPFQNNMLETTAYWHIEKGELDWTDISFSSSIES